MCYYAVRGCSMEIRLLKDCKQGQEGQVLNMRYLFAKSLIKRGLAEETEPLFRVGDLYFGEIARISDIEQFDLYKGAVSDIGFWLDVVAYGVFEYIPAEFRRDKYKSGDFYFRVSNGRKYFAENCINNIYLEEDDAVINHQSLMFLTDMEDLLKEKGWNEDTELTWTQVRQLEKELHQKHLSYIRCTRYVR